MSSRYRKRRIETFVVDHNEGIIETNRERQEIRDGSTVYQLPQNSLLPGHVTVVNNKRQLSQLLYTDDVGINIELVSQSNNMHIDDANISPSDSCYSIGFRNVPILGDDTDMLVSERWRIVPCSDEDI